MLNDFILFLFAQGFQPPPWAVPCVLNSILTKPLIRLTSVCFSCLQMPVLWQFVHGCRGLEVPRHQLHCLVTYGHSLHAEINPLLVLRLCFAHRSSFRIVSFTSRVTFNVSQGCASTLIAVTVVLTATMTQPDHKKCHIAEMLSGNHCVSPCSSTNFALMKVLVLTGRYWSRMKSTASINS